MKLTRASSYAIHALVFMAAQKQNRPVASHHIAKARGMDDPKSPLLFDGSGPDSWPEWMTDRYYALDLAGKKVPGYVLIVGGPDQVPFGFQSLLQLFEGKLQCAHADWFHCLDGDLIFAAWFVNSQPPTHSHLQAVLRLEPHQAIPLTKEDPT